MRSGSERNQLAAALAIIERAYGKPVQPNDVAIRGELDIKEVRWIRVSVCERRYSRIRQADCITSV